MGVPIWVGCEDHEYVQMGGATISTTVGSFLTSHNSRCSFKCQQDTWYESIKEYSINEFWFSVNCYSGGLATGGSTGAKFLVFLDASVIERVRVVCIGSERFAVEKIDASGTATRIGNEFFYPPSAVAGVLDKIDINMNYSTTGSMDIYINGIHVFTFLGDITTNGQTLLARHRLGNLGAFNVIYWSESWLDEDDTRSRKIIGFDMVANGNTHNFDIGSPAAANVKEIVLDDTTLDAASTAGLIDQYTNNAVPSNTLDVIAVVVSARVQRGSSGPTKVSLGVRTNGTDYWGSDQPQDVAWENVQEVFDINPDTGVAWLKTEIGAAIGFNVGAKSVA